MFRKLYTTNEHRSAPVKKFSCCMISFQTEKNEDSLLVLGGACQHSPKYKQHGAQYQSIFGSNTTNESHIFNIKTGEYIVISYYQISYSVFLCEDDS